MKRQLIVFLFFMCFAGIAQSKAPSAFTVDSLKQINQRRAAAPFVLVLWSLSCTHCIREMKTLGELAKRQGHSALVFVSTDTPGDTAAIHALLERHGLGAAESWVFADPFVERLRHAIDPYWQGELPRTYLMRDGRIAHSVSGPVDPSVLAKWMAMKADSRVTSRDGS